ncbi:hypothetical protein T01_10756 [Trichinella spiralis]|uniref:Uncharacterized protein n=1 Tax=Trichinella spiralis TaxID=6334 RepID=A0A0V1ALS5_TRISP|nr:hypothetical protein T01_10756 [Trichinella spiralis]
MPQTFSQMDNSLLDPGSKPFDIAQILFTPNNGMKVMAANEKSIYASCLPTMIISNDHILAENMQC